ncbi:hypothetical protein Droror1_Dr00021523 [Drosera rotundifolia]
MLVEPWELRLEQDEYEGCGSGVLLGVGICCRGVAGGNSENCFRLDVLRQSRPWGEGLVSLVSCGCLKFGFVVWRGVNGYDSLLLVGIGTWALLMMKFTKELVGFGALIGDLVWRLCSRLWVM